MVTMLSVALATKLLAAPLLIGLASLAGKRWGPGASGLLGGLPLVGAPVVLTLLLTDGAEPALRAASSAPIGVWATMTYLLVLGFVSRRLAWPQTLATGWLAYLAAASGLHYSGLDQWPLLGYAVLPALIFAALRLLPRPGASPRTVALPTMELITRMLAAALLVLILTAAAETIGPDFTGVLAGAPVAATVIPAFTLALSGRDALLRALRGFLTGLTGFAAFFLVLAASLPSWGSLAWLAASLAAITAGLISTHLIRRHWHGESTPAVGLPKKP